MLRDHAYQPILTFDFDVELSSLTSNLPLYLFCPYNQKKPGYAQVIATRKYL